MVILYAVMLFPLSTLGKLIEWSLVLYGTSTHPYTRHEQPRSAQLLAEDDTTEEYNGDSLFFNSAERAVLKNI